jgi:hypothetical protein
MRELWVSGSNAGGNEGVVEAVAATACLCWQVLAASTSTTLAKPKRKSGPGDLPTAQPGIGAIFLCRNLTGARENIFVGFRAMTASR